MNAKKIAVITGGTDGIGKAAAAQLAKKSIQLILVGRNKKKGLEAVNELSQLSKNQNIGFKQADLSLVSETKALAKSLMSELGHLDFLIHSAGIMLPKRELTKEGIEKVMAVQYLTRFVLTEELIPLLNKSPSAKVVTVAGGSRLRRPYDFSNFNADNKFNGMTRLVDTGAANELWTIDFNNTHAPKISLYNYYPGLVKTNLGHAMPKSFQTLIKFVSPFIASSAEQAARPLIDLIEQSFQAGFYSKHLKALTPNPKATSSFEQSKLRKLSLNSVI